MGDFFQGSTFDSKLLVNALGAGSHGVMTQYKVVNEGGLVKFPKHLSYEEASTLPCAAVTAYNSLYEGKV